MIRSECVICSDSLKVLYTVPSFPISCSPSILSVEDDVCQDMNLMYCTGCSCVQIKDLIDPEILYKEAHNNTGETPTWKAHHKEFADFVLLQGDRKLVEIGGSSGTLFQHLPANVDYMSIDLCDTVSTAFRQVKANCETYDFSEVNTIVMSHVFEHLYVPSRFLNNISRHVGKVILSIPNMNNLLTIGSCSIVFNEHTYFVDRHNIEWLFGKYGYKLCEYKEFRKHSIFMSFEKTDIPFTFILEKREHIPKTMKSIYETLCTKLSRLNIVSDVFIVPGGHMGQTISTLLHTDRIAGFLDNDITKQGARVYGTPYLVYDLDILSNQVNPRVIMYAGVYADELTKQIKDINSSISIERI